MCGSGKGQVNNVTVQYFLNQSLEPVGFEQLIKSERQEYLVRTLLEFLGYVVSMDN